MVCAIEDAGFDIRDSIHWFYGNGMPKTRNLHGEFEGAGTGLKPAHEPIVVARKPLGSTVEEAMKLYGTGALNISGCRVGRTGGTKRSGQAAYPKTSTGRSLGRGQAMTLSSSTRASGRPTSSLHIQSNVTHAVDVTLPARPQFLGLPAESGSERM